MPSNPISARTSEYWKMVENWRSVIAEPLSDDEKQNACLAILRDYVGRMALSHCRKPNPTLRFWAEMFLLNELLVPGPGCNDELGRLAIHPAFRLVCRWVGSNAQGRVVASLGTSH